MANGIEWKKTKLTRCLRKCMCEPFLECMQYINIAHMQSPSFNNNLLSMNKPNAIAFWLPLRRQCSLDSFSAANRARFVSAVVQCV